MPSKWYNGTAQAAAPHTEWRWDDQFAYGLLEVAQEISIDLERIVACTYGVEAAAQGQYQSGDVTTTMRVLKSVEDCQSVELRERILTYLRQSPTLCHLVEETYEVLPSGSVSSIGEVMETALTLRDSNSFDGHTGVTQPAPPRFDKRRGIVDRFTEKAGSHLRKALASSHRLQTPRHPQITEAPFQSDLPPSIPCLGRDAQRQALVDALDRDEQPNAAVILGGPGMGKSVLANAVLHADEVHFRYDLRIWVELEDVRTPAEMDRAICVALHLDPHCQLTACIKRIERLKRTHRSPMLLVLDGFESVWDASKYQRSTEERLAQLHAVASVLVTMRGMISPTLSTGSWRQACRLDVLDPATARQVFLLGAPFAERDPRLDDMLTISGRQPLALRLLSHHAVEGEPLARLVDLWRREKSRLLETGGDRKDESLAVSINLALVSEKIRSHFFIWSFVRLLAAFPHGMDERQLASFFVFHVLDAEKNSLGQDGFSFTSRDKLLAELHSLGLVQRHHRKNVWRFLPPIRQYIYDNFACPSELYASRYVRGTMNPQIENLFGVRVSDQHQTKLVPELTAVILRLDLFGRGRDPNRNARLRASVVRASNRRPPSGGPPTGSTRSHSYGPSSPVEEGTTEATILWAGLSAGEKFEASHVDWEHCWSGKGSLFKELRGILRWGRTGPLSEEDILTDTRERRQDEWESWQRRWFRGLETQQQTTPWLSHNKGITTMVCLLVQHALPFRVGVAGAVGQTGDGTAWSMLLPGIYT